MKRTTCIGVLAAVGGCVIAGPTSLSAQETLTIWVLQGPLDVWQSYAFPKFEAEHNVKIEAVRLSWADEMPKLTAEMATGTVPDIITLGNASGWIDGALDILEPLDSFMQNWPDRAQYPEHIWDTMQFQGKTYQLPVWLDIRGIGYRKDLFAAAGLDPNQPPNGWDQLLADAQKLTKTDAQKIVQTGFETNWFSYGIQPLTSFVLQNNGQLMDPTKHKLIFADDPAFLEAADRFQELYNLTHPAGFAAFTGNFSQGTTAMTRGLTGLVPQFQQNGQLPNLGFFVPRKNLNSPPVAQTFINGFGIPKGAAHPKLAWDLMVYLSGSEVVQQALAKKSGDVYARSDVARLEMGVQPEYAPWYNATQYLMGFPAIPNSGQIQQDVSKQLADALQGKKPLKAALVEAQAQNQLKVDEWWSSVSAK